MKHYIIFINGKCFVEFRYKDRTVRKSLSIRLSDKSEQAKLRRKLNRLILTQKVDETNINEAVHTDIIKHYLHA